MTPIDFKKANRNLLKPENMTDKQCSSLKIYTDGQVCTSKWKMNEDEIAHCVNHGYVWVSVHSGETQPPILIQAKKEF